MSEEKPREFCIENDCGEQCRVYELLDGTATDIKGPQYAEYFDIHVVEKDYADKIEQENKNCHKLIRNCTDTIANLEAELHKWQDCAHRKQDKIEKLESTNANLRAAISYLKEKAELEEWVIGDDQTEPMMHVDEYCKAVLDADDKLRGDKDE